MDPVISFDLQKFFGSQAYMSGVSWDTYSCSAALKDVFNKTGQITKETYSLLAGNLRNVRGRVGGGVCLHACTCPACTGSVAALTLSVCATSARI